MTVLLALAGAVGAGPASAQALAGAEEINFDCEPVELYQGDTLTVKFHSPHKNADLEILNAKGKDLIVSFKRGPDDKVDPVIPPEEFRNLKQLRLATATARGSLVKTWAHEATPAVLGPPQLIFTQTGNYDVVVGNNLRSPNGEIDVCDLYYYDYPRRPSKKKREMPHSRSTWGKILIAGGVCDDADLPFAGVELYDPGSNSFSDDRLKMKSMRSGAAAALIGTGPNAGRVLITGGNGYGYDEFFSSELYDPANNTFSFGPAMHDGRVWHTATAIVSGPKAGEILIAGGQGTYPGGGFIGLSSTEIYDSAANMFQRGPKMRTGRFEHSATLIVSGPNAGKVLIADGRENYEHQLSSTEIYDPVSNTISPGPAMSVPRVHHTATTIASGKNAGKILIVGGDDGRNGGIGVSPLASTELYDPATTTILAGPAMKTARKRHTATVIESGPNAGKILIAGGDSMECKGNNCHGDDLRSTELYDPWTNTFAPGPSMNWWRSGHTATTIKYGPNAGKILISGGLYYLGPPVPTDLYDPATNTFAPEARTAARDGGCDDTIAIQLPPAQAY